MLKSINLDFKHKDQLLTVTRAIANDVRINILELLNEKSLNVNEIAESLGIPVSTAAFGVKTLEEAGLIFSELQPGIRGSMKLCSRLCDNVSIKLFNPERSRNENTVIINMPIGNYVDCRVAPTCGIVGSEDNIGMHDDPKSFYYPERVKAHLIWFYEGYVEYRFPNTIPEGATAESIELSFEACSEAPFYRNDWPSDISVWINGVRLGSWTSPGDLGGRRGKYNPTWWPDTLNQYGLLVNWKVDEKGTSINDEKDSDVVFQDLHIGDEDYISVRIGLSEDAKNKGGVSIFGEHFGDYPQNIVLKITYS